MIYWKPFLAEAVDTGLTLISRKGFVAPNLWRSDISSVNEELFFVNKVNGIIMWAETYMEYLRSACIYCELKFNFRRQTFSEKQWYVLNACDYTVIDDNIYVAIDVSDGQFWKLRELSSVFQFKEKWDDIPDSIRFLNRTEHFQNPFLKSIEKARNVADVRSIIQI